MLEPVEHLSTSNESEVGRRHRGQQLEPDVRRRRARGHHGLRRLLEVVRNEPVRALTRELFEELPVRARKPHRHLTLACRQLQIGAHDRPAEPVRNLRRRKPAERQERQERPASRSVVPRQRTGRNHDDGGDRDRDRGPHAPPHDAAPTRAGLFRLRGRLPLEQATVRHEHTVERPHDRVSRDERLVRQHHDAKHELLRRERRIVQQCGVIRRPRGAAGWTHQRDGKWDAPRSRHGRKNVEHPRDAGVRQHGPACDEPREQRDRRYAAPHVVENLPAGHRRQRIDRPAVGTGHFVSEPPCKLPIPANPAVLPARCGEVAGRIVVEQFHVGHQTRSRE